MAAPKPNVPPLMEQLRMPQPAAVVAAPIAPNIIGPPQAPPVAREPASATVTIGPPVDRKIASRWTVPLIEGGWTPISDFFLEHYQRLVPPLSNTEAMLIVHLMKHKWTEAAPRPAYKTLAKRMGMSTTGVRNHARALEAKGCLTRSKRVGQPNLFHLQPLFKKLEALIPMVRREEAEQRAAAEAAERYQDQA